MKSSSPVTNTTDRLLVIYNGDGGLIKDALAIQYPIEKAIAQALVIPVPNLILRNIHMKNLKLSHQNVVVVH